MILFKLFRKLYEVIVNVWVFKIQKIKIPIQSIINIKGLPFIKNKGEVIILDNVFLNSRFSANPIGGQSKLSIIVEKDAILSIGSNCGISNSSFYCKKGIAIGNNVLIGGNCKFYDTDFHSLTLHKRLATVDDDIVSKSIKIGDGVFVGAHSIILKGVNIGENSVIGAGSVVTSSSIPSNQIWAGNPAKFIREI